MKILVVPDIHGERSLLPTQEEIDDVDKVVFLGDYLDSFHVPGVEQLLVLSEVIEIKKAYEDKVVLLLGNHDIHYLYGRYICSGYNREFALAFASLLRDNRKLFQYCYMYENHLFTHAGVDSRLLKALKTKHPTYEEDGYTLEYMINNSGIRELYYIGADSGGVDPYGGIFWIRPWSIKLPKEYIQHVGHTVNVHPRYFNPQINYYDGLGKTKVSLASEIL
jgi:3',5'-cyclic AMP phosphodiesterase CpdA